MSKNKKWLSHYRFYSENAHARARWIVELCENDSVSIEKMWNEVVGINP
jgi:hypothetical protein